MSRRPRNPSKRWLTGTVATLTAFSAVESQGLPPIAQPASAAALNPDALGLFSFQHDGVLGTSLDMIVGAARAPEARAAERAALAEIERLRKILSTYDPATEISRVKIGAPVESPELAEVLASYELWGQRTGGAISVDMAEVIRLWKEAGDRAPECSALADARATPRAYNVDALGKGYIIDRAVEAARRFAPAGLLNIGGDIRVWGGIPWRIGVADPLNPAENAPVLTRLVLRDAAVATSGGYARFHSIAGVRYSHLIDPRSLEPATFVLSATMVAADCVTANALSTAASVLGLREGAQLARLFGATDYLIVAADGQIEQSTATSSQASPAVGISSQTPPTVPRSGAAWPTNHQVSINLDFKLPPGGNRAKRPYVAVWVEDSNRKIVRTIGVLGRDFKWMRELTTWWKAADTYTDNYTQSITRATRPAGQYAVVWDGLNDKAKPVPQGEYKIFVEINREHGRHLTESAVILCGPDARTVELRETTEYNTARIEYAPKAK